jgi:hypothetical protein
LKREGEKMWFRHAWTGRSTTNIYHKMQCEKLYNLYKTTYFIVALFVSKMDKIWAIKFRPCEFDNVSDTRRMHFCYFITCYALSKENKIHHTMQREQLYNLHSKACYDCF